MSAYDIPPVCGVWKERGVTDFTQEPTDHFYGTDMGIRDPFGNGIRILQPAKAVVSEGEVAVTVGFEPTIPFRGIHTFQACSLNHSDISPG